jgi:hypothetical protein
MSSLILWLSGIWVPKSRLPRLLAKWLCCGTGSYWSETDFFERDFQLSYWGAEKYKKLLVRAIAVLDRLLFDVAV